MYTILKKDKLNSQTVRMQILAPLVAKKAMPGQFIILRVDEKGERIPLTIADYDREKGSVCIIFQKLGASTMMLGELNEGESVQDFCGPLGNASDFSKFAGERICVIGGGLGAAIAYPQAKYLNKLGAKVDSLVGFRNKELIILKDELEQVSNELIVMTDDGSNGNKGFTTNALSDRLENGIKYAMVLAIGPLVMMRAVCDITKNYGVKTIVSMNSIMIDGTGMCGGCRVSVGGERKFACVDGPDFDGHLVDFDEAIKRSGVFKAEEQAALKAHECRLTGGV